MNIENAAYEDWKKKKQQDNAAITTAAAYAAAGQNAWQKKAGNMMTELGYASPENGAAAKPGTVKVRDYLTGALPDSSQIGYSDGKVTYKNRSFTPSENRDGITYAPKSTLDDFISDVQKDNGNIGVRKTFSDLGLDTNKLGWKDGKVTYNGIEYKPTVNANGVTYGAKQDVMDFAGKALENSGDGLVQINRYKPESGLYDVGWNDAGKKVLIGGEEVPYAYIDDSGNAWVKRSIADAAYKKLAERAGVENPTAAFDKWQERADSLNNEYESMKNGRFSFDDAALEAMPEYQALKKMYTREGDRIYRDTLAGAAARTGGNVSSMARSQANQAYDYYMSKLNDTIPSLAQVAYERYKGDRDYKTDILGKQNELYSEMLGNEKTFNDQAYERYLAQQEAQRNRTLDSYDDKQNEINLKKSENELKMAENELEMQEAENAAKISDTFNTPVPVEIAEKYGIQPNDDGTYPTINQITIAKQNEIWDKYQRGVYSEQTAIELDKLAQEEAIKYEYDMLLAQNKSDMSVAAAAAKAAINARYKKGSSAGKKSTSSGSGSTSGQSSGGDEFDSLFDSILNGRGSSSAEKNSGGSSKDDKFGSTFSSKLKLKK